MLITDLTRGSSRKMLWMFSIPMLLSVAFQQVYQIADSIIAGQFIGEAALAAVGASHPITMIFMAVAVGSNIGCAVFVSRLFGAKIYVDAEIAAQADLPLSQAHAIAESVHEAIEQAFPLVKHCMVHVNPKQADPASPPPA